MSERVIFSCDDTTCKRNLRMIEQKNKYLQESTNLEHELETQTGNTHWKQNLKYELKIILQSHFQSNA